MKHDRAVAISFTAVMILLTSGTGPARAGLVSEWRFDETGGTIAHDNIGGINDTLFGGAAFDPGSGPGPGVYSGAISLGAATIAMSTWAASTHLPVAASRSWPG